MNKINAAITRMEEVEIFRNPRTVHAEADQPRYPALAAFLL